MKTIKRTLATILAIVMCFSMSTFAFAADSSTPSENPTTHEKVSKQEELPLKLLSELYVIVSHHTAPNYTAVGNIPNFQCANNFVSRFAISLNQFTALFLEFLFLYFLLTHLTKHLFI